MSHEKDMIDSLRPKHELPQMEVKETEEEITLIIGSRTKVPPILQVLKSPRARDESGYMNGEDWP